MPPIMSKTRAQLWEEQAPILELGCIVSKRQACEIHCKIPLDLLRTRTKTN